MTAMRSRRPISRFDMHACSCHAIGRALARPERVHVWCSVLGAMPTLVVGMFPCVRQA